MTTCSKDNSTLGNRARQIFSSAMRTASRPSSTASWAKLIGFDGVGVQMPHRLGASCSGARNGLPGLTSIVVKEDIGLPREGTRSKASPLEQARTYDRDWYGIEPPTAEALEKPTRIIATLLNENERKRQTPWRPACIDNHGGGKRRHWVLGGTRSVRLLSCCLTCLVRGQ